MHLDVKDCMHASTRGQAKAFETFPVQLTLETMSSKRTGAFVHSWLLKLEEVSKIVDAKAETLKKQKQDLHELEETLLNHRRCEARCAAGQDMKPYYGGRLCVRK